MLRKSTILARGGASDLLAGASRGARRCSSIDMPMMLAAAISAAPGVLWQEPRAAPLSVCFHGLRDQRDTAKSQCRAPPAPHVAMKRKVVTVTEYYCGIPSGSRSVLQRLLDALAPVRHDFYPLEQKRHFYADGATLKSIAFADGTLYGGCCALGCPRRCVGLEEFEPDSGMDFQFALRAHSSALLARDLDVATEQRGVLDETRDPRCRACRSVDAPALPAPPAAAEASSEPGDGAEPGAEPKAEAAERLHPQ